MNATSALVTDPIVPGGHSKKVLAVKGKAGPGQTPNLGLPRSWAAAPAAQK